jgi:lipopolysaccharide biosynthesis regulator YciM
MNEPMTAVGKPRSPAPPAKTLRPEEFQQLLEDRSLSFPPVVRKALQVHAEIEQAIEEWKEAIEQASNVLNMKLRSIGVRVD